MFKKKLFYILYFLHTYNMYYYWNESLNQEHIWLYCSDLIDSREKCFTTDSLKMFFAFQSEITSAFFSSVAHNWQ